MCINDINKKMVRNVFLNTEILLNEGENEIFEYDIQAYMFLFFRSFLRSFKFTAGREKAGKVDCVLFDENSNPVVFYEIKTYFKGNESIRQEHFDKDINKLASLIKKNENSRGYFFTSGLTKKYDTDEAKKLPFIASHMRGERDWSDYVIDDGTNIKLRPSVKEVRGLCNTMTWEIKL